MRRLGFAIGPILVVAAALAGCDNGPKAGQLEHFPDEKPLDGPAQLSSPAAVHLSPTAGGTPLVMLPRGAAVTKVARHGTLVLVSFQSSKTGPTPVSGWIPQEALPGLGGGL